MRIDQAERDLQVIRKAIEASSRYTNLTARGYFFSGIVALIGTWRTYQFLGAGKVADMRLITAADLPRLALIWTLVLAASLVIAVFFSWWKARQNKISAWNSLSARMFLSQLPLIGVAGLLTVGLALKGYYEVIPVVWLGCYGVIFYSFSYYTGKSQKIEGLVFITLATIAMFAPGPAVLACLGMGFGVVHIVSGIGRWIARGVTRHESN